jgi:DNA-binding transcriptional LysR family regulator
MLNSVELRHLRYFLVVAEELHFNRAAERLHMQQPPLSRQIRQLEKAIGTDLFHRTTRSVSLTPAGRAFEDEARKILRAVDGSAEVAQQAALGVTGRLGVGFTGSNTYSLLPLVASTFRKEMPNAVLHAEGEMLAPAQTEALITRQLDVCFGRKRPPNPEIESRVIWQEPLSVVLPQNHHLAGEEAIRVADLADENFVTYPSRTGSVMFELTMSTCVEAGFAPRIVQEATQTSTLVSLVAAGFGVAIAPQSVQHIQVAGAVHRPLVGQHAVSDLVLAWRRDNDFPLLHRFLDIVSRIAKPSRIS